LIDGSPAMPHPAYFPVDVFTISVLANPLIDLECGYGKKREFILTLVQATTNKILTNICNNLVQ
jgi:hypothetical protein